MFLSQNSTGQSIGYSFSYTMPYNDIFNRSEIGFFGGYEKRSEYSIGISFNNYVRQVKAIQVRLSHYNSRFILDRSSFFGGNYEESKVGQFLIELEGYILAKEYSSGFGISLGTKYSLLLRSEHESFTVNQGVETKQKNINFDGLRKFKFEFLARINMTQFNLSKDLSLRPAYVFGYGFTNDFNLRFIGSSAINHRFEITLFKSLSPRQ